MAKEGNLVIYGFAIHLNTGGVFVNYRKDSRADDKGINGVGPVIKGPGEEGFLVVYKGFIA
jgi:hypothetical protein